MILRGDFGSWARKKTREVCAIGRLQALMLKCHTVRYSKEYSFLHLTSLQPLDLHINSLFINLMARNSIISFSLATVALKGNVTKNASCGHQGIHLLSYHFYWISPTSRQRQGTGSLENNLASVLYWKWNWNELLHSQLFL